MIIVIVGPTGVGKTKLAIQLAKQQNGEVINADSTQVYKGLNIGTAKTIDKTIPHHLFDIVDITNNYTVYDYQKDCRKVLKEVLEKNKTPILVGGSGLYLKAALYDYQFEEETLKKYDNLSTEQIYQQLIKLDSNNQIHPHNRQRLIRALSYCETNHKPFSEKPTKAKLLYDVVVIGLTTERKLLYQQIDKRVDEMVSDGLLEEARQIYESKVRTKAIMTPIAYKELFPYFEGGNLDECLKEIKKNSKRYAKRQYTWFNNQMDVTWFEVDFNDFNKTIEEVTNYINHV